MNRQDDRRIAESLIRYIGEATSPFHVVETSARRFEEAGFQKLDFTEEWTLGPGKYYTIPYGTTMFAFCLPELDSDLSFHIASAHTDYPCFRVKPQAEMEAGGYLKLNVEPYGGAIYSTWLDRPLSIAGKVALKSQDIYQPILKVIDFKRPLLTIPNLAIHLNREVNKGVQLNQQTQLLPIIGMLEENLSKEHFLLDLLASELGCAADDILDFDLYIYNMEEGCILGLNDEFISCPRLDNLTSCYAIMEGLLGGTNKGQINVAAFYDNEEIGSRSKQGADSNLTSILLEKIYAGLGKSREDLTNAILRSFMISMDVAHSLHPNYMDKYDPTNQCRLNGGVALKLSFSQRYATDTEAIAIIQQLAESADVPYQKFVNRSDIPGGSTLGSISAAYLPMKAVDLGVGILAMHSAREMMGLSDQAAITRLATAFFQ